MKTLYIECNMGAAGDMLMSALSELHHNSNNFVERLNALKIPGVLIEKKTAVKCRIKGTHIDVTVHGHHEDEHMHEHHEHHHTGMHEIEHIISHFDLPQKVKNDILSVYRIIAEAESHAHGAPIDEIHFHEIGSMDAVADITGVCMLMNELAPEKIIVSPICTGFGQIKCAHGILPVPAPATAYILKDVPIYSGNINGELCTPTGAALLKYFADKFDTMPAMRVSKIGYGMGNKDFETANCVRAMLGDTAENADTITEISCNIDDMSAEEISFAFERIMAADALDVYTIPIGMKKNRQGTMLTCLCRSEDTEKICDTIFKYTSTLGLRLSEKKRKTLERQTETIKTKYGNVRIKRSFGFGTKQTKIEYDDIAAIAEKLEISINDARKLIEKESAYEHEI
ncbi:MAG: nickel pincer cofactor biosynthesis protein LarC [Lachnospirales bacterium]